MRELNLQLTIYMKILLIIFVLLNYVMANSVTNVIQPKAVNGENEKAVVQGLNSRIKRLDYFNNTKTLSNNYMDSNSKNVKGSELDEKQLDLKSVRTKSHFPNLKSKENKLKLGVSSRKRPQLKKFQQDLVGELLPLSPSKSKRDNPTSSKRITTTGQPTKRSAVMQQTDVFNLNFSKLINDKVSKKELYFCPQESEVRFQLFPKICEIDRDCNMKKKDELCCEIFGSKTCVTGILKPLKELSHTPLLGLISRTCPKHQLAELWWKVEECDTDSDCWPRICCPDGRKRYCRTSQPDLSAIPDPIKRLVNYLTEYLECTAPPPPIFDLYPKACTSTLDCFPNVCCQEAGLKHCRPPKKSVLTLLTNILNVDFVKRITQSIIIK